MENFIWFCVWWMILNGAGALASLYFFMNCTGIEQKTGKMIAFFYLAFNALMTVVVTCVKLPGVQVLDVVFLMFFAHFLEKISWEKLAAPITILFTLMTLTEGFLAIAMSWVSKNLSLQHQGFWVQVTAAFILKILFILLLIGVQGRWSFTLNQPRSSDLYLLILPCFITICAVRCGLRLDSAVFENYLSSFGTNATVALSVLMVAAVLVFFFVMEMFGKIRCLTDAGQEAAVLKSQLEGQKLYLEEARKRNKEYASFRHDIHHHMLVLTGLMRQELNPKAMDYARTFDKNSRNLSVSIATGRLVLDILLQEKISQARRCGIRAVCKVEIPEIFGVQDMDLCVIAGNIMDNAIQACKDVRIKDPFLSIRTINRAGFLVIEAVNTAENPTIIKPGIGIENIKMIAEKYMGTLEMEADNNRFCIRVLLCGKND